MRPIIITIILVTSQATVSWCQSSIENLIVGKWTTIDQYGDSGSFYFDKNKTMYISSHRGDIGRGETVVEGGRKVKTLMKYELNLKEKPVQIDVYLYVDNFYNPVGKSEGILEVLDDNTIWLALNFDKPLPSRPKDFKNLQESGIIFRTNVINDVKGCENFRDGKYTFVHPLLGTIRVERQGNLQFETTEKGEKTKFKVEWLDDCSYNLAPVETYTHNTWSPDTTGLIMNVRIVHTRAKSYVYTSSFNKSRVHLTGELFKIKD